MPDILIPSRHQSAPHGEPPHATQSLLRELHNKVVGIRYHRGLPVQEMSVLTASWCSGLDQGLLDEAFALRQSAHGKRRGIARLLLELLGAVDYAGKQHRPVMLVGHKVKAGGFQLKVVVPIDTAKRPGPPPDVRSNGDGVVRKR